MTYRLVASAINHPDRVNSLWGLFNRRSLTALSRAGVDVTAVVPRPYAPPFGPFSEFSSIPAVDGGNPYPVVHPRFWYLLPKSLFYHRSGDSMAKAVERYLQSTEVAEEVYHACHLYPDGYALGMAGSVDGAPLTAYAHGTILNEFDSFNEKTQTRIRDALASVDVLFCSSEAVRRRARSLDGTVEAAVVPIGATPEHFPTERRSRLRRELNVPPDATVVLYCGRFSRKKGIPDLVEALAGVEDESKYVVAIGHGGEMREDLADCLSGPDPPKGRVLWQLHPVAVRRWYAIADLLVLPSYSEGRPTVIYEAMASETPVLATAVGGVPEQVEDGQTGWLVEPGDVEALRSGIEESSPEELAAMGDAGLARLEEKGWTWDAHAERIGDTHRRLLEES